MQIPEPLLLMEKDKCYALDDFMKTVFFHALKMHDFNAGLQICLMRNR